MSTESMEWLNKNVLIGFTEERGTAWHYRKSDQGTEPNHYPGSIPLGDVERRLFHWDPDEADLYADLGLTMAKAHGHKAIVRSDTGEVLGIVSASYTVHPYRSWLLDNVSGLLGDSAGIGSAGLLKNGARAWVQVEVPETVKTREGVDFRPFLTATTTLDGSASTTYLTGAQVVVCDNTLNAALKDENAAKLRIRHTKHSWFDVHDAREALDLLHVTKDAFEAHVREQCAIKVSEAEWHQFLLAHFPLKDEDRFPKHPNLEARRTVDYLWRKDPRVEPWRGTAYGVIAAVNTFQHHYAAGQPRAQRSRAERNALRAATGGFDKIDAKVLKTLSSIQSP
ncbi:DUF932 domain-containing protein [Intrasporangium calvum]|uniref:DUF932 domain-containing protein n=1 Tax=Intrasporangium calvum TaxID=53358 RepID=A0ABT5GF47_9MICO|nr:DUF932 domain-containing protein [Intrasporangium calvum]MDC5696829.1 DUF932 domain-containing protein [Intrasporangium calvum]